MGFNVKTGADTVIDLLAVPVKLPLVPVMAILPVPTVAAVVAETVAVALAPGFRLDGLNVTVTPLGAVALSATRSVKPAAAEIATEKVAVWPWKTETAAADGVSVTAGATTVTGSLAMPVKLPLVAVMAMLPAPAGAVAAAVTVAVALAPGLRLAGLKLTFTPLGAVAFRVTFCVYPLLAASATVNVAVLPCRTETEEIDGLIVSVGAAMVTGSFSGSRSSPSSSSITSACMFRRREASARRARSPFSPSSSA